MIDTNGDEIFFMRTIKTGLTKDAADELSRGLNQKLFSDRSDFYEVKWCG